MSSLFWRRRAPIGSTAETYRSMVWNNPTLPAIGGHFSFGEAGMTLGGFNRSRRGLRARLRIETGQCGG